jgi:hypothetical protein
VKGCVYWAEEKSSLILELQIRTSIKGLVVAMQNVTVAYNYSLVAALSFDQLIETSNYVAE